MSDASQAIDGTSLNALIACHIAAYGRSIRNTDPWLFNQLRDADNEPSKMASIAINCVENHNLLHDFPEANSIGWRLFRDGFDLAIELSALVSRSPLTPNLEAIEETFDEARSGIGDIIRFARAERAMEPSMAEARA